MCCFKIYSNVCIVKHDICNCFTAKVSVSNFKVEKCENLDDALYVFLTFFFDMALQKT